MKRIKLTQGKYALVDDEDFEKVNQYKWCASCTNGYCRASRSIRKTNGKWTRQLMYRYIIDVPEGMDIDHRNHNTLDNRKCNLRICTHGENQMNRKIQQQRKTSSQFKGIHWRKTAKKWEVRIGLNGKRICLGSFNNEIMAAKAYDKKAKELYGKFACLNFGGEL